MQVEISMKIPGRFRCLPRYFFTKKHDERGVGLLLLVSLLFHSPSSLFAQYYPPYYTDPEKKEEHTVAIGLALATALVLVGTLSYAAASGGRGCRSSSSSPNGNTAQKNADVLNLMDDPNNPVVNPTNSAVVVTTSFPASYYDNEYFNIFENDNVTEFNAVNNDAELIQNETALFINENIAENALFDTFRAAALSGSIAALPSASSKTNGSLTFFVRIPDGSTRTLGTLPFLIKQEPLSLFGPFHQRGIYYFGAAVEQGTKIRSKAKVALISLQINGSTQENFEIELPANPPENYETPLQSFHF